MLVGIEQDEIVHDHAVFVIAQAIDKLRGVGAAAADHGHLRPHVCNVTSDVPFGVSEPAAAEPVVLAVDGGSTKTDAVLVSSSGALLGRARVGPSNHQLIGVDGMLDALVDAVRPPWPTLGLDASTRGPVARLGVFCLAGIDLPIDEERLAPAIESRGWAGDVVLRNDTFAVSRAGTTSPWGVGVVCGTGMNCAGIGPDGRSRSLPRAGRALRRLRSRRRLARGARARPRSAGG